MTEKLSIAIVHKAVKRYRVPLFDRLDATYDTTFFITRQSEQSLAECDSTAEYTAVRTIELFAALVRGDFDLIVNPDFPSREAWVGALAAAVTNTNLVQWTEVWDMPHPTFGERQYKSVLLRALGPVTDSYVVPGIKWKEYLLWHSDAEPQDIFIAPNASNVPPSETAPSKREFGVDGDPFIVTYVGRLRRVKRVEDVVKAVNRLGMDNHDVHLLVAGEGNEKYTRYLRTLVDDLGVSATFLGWVDNSLANLYKITDICVAPSRRDAFVLVSVEAMSFGTPMIVSRGVGAANEVVIHGENGFVVPEKDPLSIYECMAEFFESAEKRAKLSERAEETIQDRVTYEQMLTGFQNAFHHAVEDATGE